MLRTRLCSSSLTVSKLFHITQSSVIQCCPYIKAICSYFPLPAEFGIDNQIRAYSAGDGGGSGMVGLVLLVGILV